MLSHLHLIDFVFSQASLQSRPQSSAKRYALETFIARIFKVALLFICQSSYSSEQCSERRRRDLNPRAAINDLHPFQGCPFNHLGTSPKCLNNYICNSLNRGGVKTSERRGWDSNPRALADKRFSRPPRYDHFDTSPCSLFTSDLIIITNVSVIVNRFLHNFLNFFCFS